MRLITVAASFALVAAAIVLEPPRLPAHQTVSPMALVVDGERDGDISLDLLKSPPDVPVPALDTEPDWSRFSQPDGPRVAQLHREIVRVGLAVDGAGASSPTPCAGHWDTSPGCPGDPANWVCARDGKGGAKACGCKQHCRSDGHGGQEAYDESADCPRRCNKKCLCHVEEDCPTGPAR